MVGAVVVLLVLVLVLDVNSYARAEAQASTPGHGASAVPPQHGKVSTHLSLIFRSVYASTPQRRLTHGQLVAGSRTPSFWPPHTTRIEFLSY